MWLGELGSIPVSPIKRELVHIAVPAFLATS
jgi:hypothetical protein